MLSYASEVKCHTQPMQPGLPLHNFPMWFQCFLSIVSSNIDCMVFLCIHFRFIRLIVPSQSCYFHKIDGGKQVQALQNILQIWKSRHEYPTCSSIKLTCYVRACYWNLLVRRPITLMLVIYKFIGKIIANRIKDTLLGCLHVNQYRFIPRRQITDNCWESSSNVV